MTNLVDAQGRALIRYTADLVVFAEDRVLAIVRGTNPFKGRLALPGGHVDHGETSLAAVVRETAEETGLRVSASQLRRVDIFDAVDRDPRGRVVSVAYVVAFRHRPYVRPGSDAARAVWVTPDDAMVPGRMAFDHADILAAAYALLRDGHLDRH
ncbi:NUDIX hydrolase [Glycomyces sp. MUSA5-2]|uniref:NUDIX hydrolase n=1 Tax=Glycomyces sp. MUSA5-2 TaxID=2053002 RepID=UPI00300A818B